jgi:hypothetical protein
MDQIRRWSMKEKFKVGDIVKVKVFDKRPSHWNDKGGMDGYMGKEFRIELVFSKMNNPYRLEGIPRWVWRDGDFDIVDASSLSLEDQINMIINSHSTKEVA